VAAKVRLPENRAEVATDGEQYLVCKANTVWLVVLPEIVTISATIPGKILCLCHTCWRKPMFHCRISCSVHWSGHHLRRLR
jgi:hypothetical protein